MKKWNLIVDVERCHNCGNCVLANQDEHVDNNYPGYAAPQPHQGGAWIRIETVARGTPPMVDAAHLPTLCNHCDNAPCVVAGGGAVKKRADGIVIVDPLLAKGRKDLLTTCPYGAMHWNEELDVPQIWIFDAHLLDQGWKEPRCSQVCPTGALQAVKMSDEEMRIRAKTEGLEVLQDALNTRPRVYYRNLYRHSRCFIGGSVAYGIGEASECVSGATVTLSHDGERLQQVLTDGFGDFKFDNLARNSGRYRLDIEHAVFGRASRETKLSESLYLGVIRLDSNPSAPQEVFSSSTLELHHA
ncbi:4Fe-4S dicluster domain-containing protein [Zobellella sp. An-6]|uniref:4Fe-4S dicluster domain-containing protein n=1 Tax=Zobellella sp. An-6 TaxID=3400218 RepID=UPI004043491A